jgi:hypothetical protein
MHPAVLANLIGSGGVEAVSGTQLLDQLAAKLGLLGLFSSPDFDLLVREPPGSNYAQTPGENGAGETKIEPRSDLAAH